MNFAIFRLPKRLRAISKFSFSTKWDLKFSSYAQRLIRWFITIYTIHHFYFSSYGFGFDSVRSKPWGLRTRVTAKPKTESYIYMQRSTSTDVTKRHARGEICRPRMRHWMFHNYVYFLRGYALGLPVHTVCRIEQDRSEVIHEAVWNKILRRKLQLCQNPGTPNRCPGIPQCPAVMSKTNDRHWPWRSELRTYHTKPVVVSSISENC